MGDTLNTKDDYIFHEMRKECRLAKWLGHRKSAEYKWSNSGSENPAENNIRQRPTKWIYDHILKYLGIDLYKGLNGDQYRAYFLALYLLREEKWVLGAACKVIFGFIVRLGMFPSLMEHCIFKPQIFVCLFRVHWVFYPMYLLCLPIFILTKNATLKQPLLFETTNKITLLPTMKALGYELPFNRLQIAEIYYEYWKPGSTDQFMADTMIFGLTKEG
jgi:hypothetical protein